MLDDQLENNHVDFREPLTPPGQEGFSADVQKDKFLGGGGKSEADGSKPQEGVSQSGEQKEKELTPRQKEISDLLKQLEKPEDVDDYIKHPPGLRLDDALKYDIPHALEAELSKMGFETSSTFNPDLNQEIEKNPNLAPFREKIFEGREDAVLKRLQHEKEKRDAEEKYRREIEESKRQKKEDADKRWEEIKEERKRLKAQEDAKLEARRAVEEKKPSLQQFEQNRKEQRDSDIILPDGKRVIRVSGLIPEEGYPAGSYIEAKPLKRERLLGEERVRVLGEGEKTWIGYSYNVVSPVYYDRLTSLVNKDENNIVMGLRLDGSRKEDGDSYMPKILPPENNDVEIPQTEYHLTDPEDAEREIAFSVNENGVNLLSGSGKELPFPPELQEDRNLQQALLALAGIESFKHSASYSEIPGEPEGALSRERMDDLDAGKLSKDRFSKGRIDDFNAAIWRSLRLGKVETFD